MSFRKELIKKWEDFYGHLHKSSIELEKGKEIPYWDNKFVEDLILYAGKLYKKSELLKKQLEEILKQLKEQE